MWEKARVGCFKRTASKHVYYLGWNRSPAQVGCMRQALGPGALGKPRGSGWKGRWEGESRWGTHVNPWLFHFNVWQNPLQKKKHTHTHKNLALYLISPFSLCTVLVSWLVGGSDPDLTTVLNNHQKLYLDFKPKTKFVSSWESNTFQGFSSRSTPQNLGWYNKVIVTDSVRGRGGGLPTQKLRFSSIFGNE